jgi:hypothetical protein
MARRLREVGLDFVETAPVRLVFAQEVSVPPERVHRGLTEDIAAWSAWFPSVTLSRPVDDGAGREIRLRGGAWFRETVLVSTSPGLYAYRADESNAPGLRALVEEWRLAPSGTGTRVQWTIAADGTGVLRALLRVARGGLAREHRNAVRNLERRLR